MKSKFLIAFAAILVVGGLTYASTNSESLMGAFGVGPKVVLSLASSPVSGELVVPSSDQQVLGFKLQCKSKGACLVTGLEFQGFLDDDGNASSLASSSASTTHGTRLSDYVDDVKVVDSSSNVVAGPESVSGSFTVTFNDSFSIPANTTSTYYLVLDTDSGAYADGDAENIAFAIRSSQVVAEDSSGNSMTIQGQANGGKLVQFETSQDSLTVSLASSPVSDTVVKGTDDVPFVGITFTCNATTDCLVTDVNIQGYLDDDGNSSSFVSSASGTTHATSLSAYVSALYLANADDPSIDSDNESVNSSTFAVSFSGMTDFVIAAGTSERFILMGDLSSSAYANGDAENIAFGVASAADVTAENADGNSIVVTGTVNTEPMVVITSAN